ncbi:MAG: hypothetical protein ACPGWS_05650 [Solirubrobacterales bacterium]
MSKTTTKNRRSGKPWTGADLLRLKVLAEHQIPAARIARKLGRTEAAVRTEAAKQRVMLAPPDKSSKADSRRKLHPTEKQPYGGIKIRATRPDVNRSTVSRRQAPFQNETLF